MTVVKINPMRLPPNPWIEGYVLDYHTISSTPTSDPYYRFDTKRTPLGELLFQLKYRAGGSKVLTDIVDTVAEFVETWKPKIECLVPAPASLSRKKQPTVEVARALAIRLHVAFFESAVVKLKTTPQMKNIDDWSERQRLLADAVQAGRVDVAGRCILLFDDLIESGATLRRTAQVLLEDRGARRIYALVLTRTK